MLHHITGPRPLHTLVVAALLFSASLNLYLLHSKVQLGVGDGVDGRPSSPPHGEEGAQGHHHLLPPPTIVHPWSPQPLTRLSRTTPPVLPPVQPPTGSPAPLRSTFKCRRMDAWVDVCECVTAEEVRKRSAGRFILVRAWSAQCTALPCYGATAQHQAVHASTGGCA